jgi:ribonuclease P protein component
MSHQFTRDQRLLTSADFQRVFDNPLKSADSFFTVLAKKRLEGTDSRLGLAIAKKQLKRAVDRNRIKRLIRETFRQEPLLEEQAIDFIVMTRHSVRAKTNAELQQSLQQLFAQALSKLDQA